MDSLISFFDNLPVFFRSIILIGGIALFWILEGVFPIFQSKYSRIRHAGINLFFTVTTAIVGFGLAGVLLWTSDFVSAREIGLLYIIDLPLWAQMVVGVLLMDLIGAYFIHWLSHRVKWMWKFHVVHHSDTNVDVTTGLRQHPGETIFRIFFTIMAVCLIGAPMWIIMIYQSMSVLAAHISHANVNLPAAIDRGLSFVFVTPHVHKVHHHYKRPLTDTNYGNIFIIWDRLFGTFKTVSNTNELIYGVDTHMESKENSSISNLLAIPFQPYREPAESELGSEGGVADDAFSK
ncbi:MAG: sterol desaturase family protein [Cyclobacteriaceae bacterium]